MPKTRLGKWSVELVIICFLLLATGVFIISRQGARADQTFFDNPVASIPMLSAGASAIAAFFAGIICIWRYKEKSPFVLGEILFPH